MTDNSFSLIDLFPKYVINSKGDKTKFDEKSIAKILNRETGLEMNISESVAEEVIRKIIGLGIKEITTNYIRELVCVELTQRGLNKYRNLFARAINLESVGFKLDESFLDQFKGRQPNWGPIGYITYKRTYARLIEGENRKEEFWETLRRVVEGCYSIQKEHCMKLSLPWDDTKAQKSSQIMYQKIWDFKCSPPGRGLWMMGTEFIARHGSMSLNNCGFASTEDIDLKYSKAFEFVMDALMLGVGVGFDTKGAGKIKIKRPTEGTFNFEIPDSREGWVDALKLLLEAYFLGMQAPTFDFSKIRKAGEPIRGFGGIASGPKPLKEMLEDIQKILEIRMGQIITSVDIVDIMNYIGKCVVAGNVRRSAEIALGDPTDLDFVTCKQDEKALYSHRWASNNSVFAVKGLDYSFIANQIAVNGEPGILWLENARAYSRMGDKPDFKDKKAAGVNPCITGDTLVAVADGRGAVSIKQLAEEGDDIPVYCKDDKGLTLIRMMRNPRITGYNEEIYEVKLDDDSIITCTGNHKFVLRNMTHKEARELRNGDSLMITPKWQTTWAEIMGETKKKRSIYWMLNDGKKNTFEHSFIYEKFNKCKIPSGYVIHHKDNDGLNNRIDNLELMLKDDHDSLHDISGDKNPMRWWWQTATEVEKRNYRRKMSEALSGEKNPRYSGFTDDEIYNEMLNLINKTELPLSFTRWKKHATKIGMPFISPRWGESQSPIDLIRKGNIEYGFDWYDDHVIRREYNRFIKLLKKIDLELLFEDGIIYTYKSCEGCGRRFKVKYARREQAYCSHLCVLQTNLEKAQNAHKDKAKKIRDEKRIKLFDLLIKEIAANKIIPTKSEFIEILRNNDIKDFRTIGMPDSYSQVLDNISEIYGIFKINSKKITQNKQYAKEIANLLIENGLIYNHKVISVKRIGRDVVYNGTVDEFHNFGIIINEKETKSGRPRIEIAFTVNCGEQTLESFELCCLAETFPSRHESYEEFQETLKYAYLYSKSVTLVNTHWQETNAVMLKNRRMGISQTGIIEAFVKHGRRKILDWCARGYNYLRELDEQYSDWLCIPKSVKITTVKPSGTVSLLPGVPPGIHYPHSEYYIRRIRLSKNSDLIPIIKNAGYNVEDDVYSPNTVVAEFPIHEKYFNRSKNDVSIWEQAENAAAYQKYWADNQVSITVTFKQDEADQIKYVLEAYEDKLKSVSFLPIKEHGYKQAPYEEITKKAYEEMIENIKPLNLDETKDREIGSKFCDAEGKCDVPFEFNDK